MSLSAPRHPARDSNFSTRTTGRPHSLTPAHFCLHGFPHAHRETSAVGVTPWGLHFGGQPQGQDPVQHGALRLTPHPHPQALVPRRTPGWPCAQPPSISTSAQGKGSTAVSGWAPSGPPPPPAWSWVFTQKVEWAGVARAEALALGLGLGVDKALSRPPLRGPERPRCSAEPRAHKCSVHPGCGWGKATSLRSACLGLTVPPAPHSALQVTQTGLGEVGRRGSRDPGLRARALLFRGGGEAQLHRSTEDVVHGGGAWCARPRRL